jgi:hypothetical protein
MEKCTLHTYIHLYNCGFLLYVMYLFCKEVCIYVHYNMQIGTVEVRYYYTART